MAHRFHPTLLREYDMRGVVGPMLGEADGYALGAQLRDLGAARRRISGRGRL